MPADRTTLEDGQASRDTDFAPEATADTDEAVSASSSSLPSQTRYGPANPALTLDYADYASSIAAYAHQGAFLFAGSATQSDLYGNQQLAGSQDVGGGGSAPLTSSPLSARDQGYVPSFGSADWDPTYSSFLDLAQAYEPQGELAHEQSRPNQPPVFSIPQPVAPRPTSTPNISIPDSSKAHRFATSPLAPPPVPLTPAKRKAESEPDSADTEKLRGNSPGGQAGRNRTVSFERMSKPTLSPSAEGVAGTENTGDDRFGARVGQKSRQPYDNGGQRGHTPLSGGSQGVGMPPGILRSGSKVSPTSILPAEKVFPIQIGSELFRLSGASIASDAPSYFSQFFEDQIRQNEDGGGVRTLYIDRDPVTFQDISRHLQGYHIKPRDGSHFVKLFADAQFYSLPRLISQLFESEIFIQIGDRNFQIPRDIFSGPGDSPNFFSLGFAVFFSTPGEVFPGLDRKGLLRPPSIIPPSVPNRSADVFAQLLHLLRGYPLHIQNEDHRAELLRDCRYFHLRGLEQRLIAHEISYNLERQKSEIVLCLEDIRQSGVSFISDVSPADNSPSSGWVNYARPFIDDTSYELVLEIGGEFTILDLNAMRADFHGLAKARISSLFQVIANKMNLPTNAPLGLMMMSGGASAHTASPGHTPLSEDRVKIRIDRTADITLDGEPFEVEWTGFPAENTMTHQIQTSGGPSGGPSSEHIDPEAEGVMSTQMSRASSSAGGPLQQPPQPPPSSQQPSPVIQGGGAPPPRIQTSNMPPSKKRKRRGSLDSLGEWIVRKGQWRLRVQANPQDAVRGGLEIVFVAVKLDAFTGERARNGQRGFLT